MYMIIICCKPIPYPACPASINGKNQIRGRHLVLLVVVVVEEEWKDEITKGV